MTILSFCRDCYRCTGRIHKVAVEALAVLLALVLYGGLAPAGAQPIDVPATWGGDFWDRPRLTGSWGGLRDELGKKGVVFDADLLLTPQGVLTGGRDTGWEFWGNADYTLNVDTGKLGLWPGGFLKVYAGSTFGESLFDDTGALVPANAAWLVGDPNEPSTTLMQASFMQFLSPKFGLMAGKFFTLVDDTGQFTGNFRTQFMNTGLAIPMSFALVPISAYGGGVVVLPWKGVVLSALVLDPDGTPLNNDITEAFDDGVMVLATGQVAVKPFGRKGTQKLGFMWSDGDRLSVDQDPSNIARLLLTERFPLLGTPGPVLQRILERFFPQLLVPVQPANQVNSTWAMYYGFEQYLWHPGGDTTRGIGIFFNFGASDGEAPSSTPTAWGSAARAWSRGGRTTRSASAGPAPSSATTSWRSCAIGSGLASSVRTRSRSSTTPR
jgi:porin